MKIAGVLAQCMDDIWRDQMGAIVNKIVISDLSVSKKTDNQVVKPMNEEASEYCVDVRWETTESAGVPYSGGFIVKILSDGAVLKEETIKTGHCAAMYIPSSFAEKLPVASVFTADGLVFSDEVSLLFDSYNNPFGTYDGCSFHLKWDKPSINIGQGICEVCSRDSAAVVSDIEQYSRYIHFTQYCENFDADDILTVSLRPSRSDISYGPKSEVMSFFCMPISIKKITSGKAEKCGKVHLYIEFMQGYTKNDNMKVLPVLKKDLDIINLPAVDFTEAENGCCKAIIEVDVDIISPENFTQYDIYLYLCTHNAKSIIASDNNHVNLSQTDIFVKGYYFKKLSDGVFSISPKIYSADETEYVVSFNERFYKKVPLEDIALDGITLTKDYPHKLIIQTSVPLTKETYKKWMGKVSDSGILALGIYRLQEIISRSAQIQVSDTLFFHCGLDEETLMSDVRPGFTLCIETESFIPQYDPNADVNAGYVTSHTSEYSVCMRYEDDVLLEFNSFIDRFSDNFYSKPSNKNFAGGAIDLFQKSMRQPFYKLCYPSGFKDSDVESSVYPSDNIVLLASPSYKELLRYSDDYTKFGQWLDNQTTTAMLMFRGRSSVSLCINVWLNGEKNLVPIGTTLSKLLEKTAAFVTDNVNVKIKRWCVDGYYDVFIKSDNIDDRNTLFKTFCLMHADRVEVI